MPPWPLPDDAILLGPFKVTFFPLTFSVNCPPVVPASTVIAPTETPSLLILTVTERPSLTSKPAGEKPLTLITDTVLLASALLNCAWLVTFTVVPASLNKFTKANWAFFVTNEASWDIETDTLFATLADACSLVNDPELESLMELLPLKLTDPELLVELLPLIELLLDSLVLLEPLVE